MKRLIAVLALVAAGVSACANLQAEKSPCAGAAGSPCTRTPLVNDSVEGAA
jgi:hypothetical protein